MSLKSLLVSRKFWLMMLDVVVSTATFFVTNYVNPEYGKIVLFLIATWQPAFLLVINSITQQNLEAMKQEAMLKRQLVDQEHEIKIYHSTDLDPVSSDEPAGPAG